MFKYSNGYWEAYKRFQRDVLVFFRGQGLRKGIIWGDLSMEEFVMGEENFHEGAVFSSII